MWKYIAAGLLVVVGIVEIFLALNARAREAVMKNSLVRSKQAEPVFLLVAGLSALAMALGILFYNLYW